MCRFLLQTLLTFSDYPLGLKVGKHGLPSSIRGDKPSKTLLLMKTAISKKGSFLSPHFVTEAEQGGGRRACMRAGSAVVLSKPSRNGTVPRVVVPEFHPWEIWFHYSPHWALNTTAR